MLCIAYNIRGVDLERSRQNSSVMVISRLESVGQDSGHWSRVEETKEGHRRRMFERGLDVQSWWLLEARRENLEVDLQTGYGAGGPLSEFEFWLSLCSLCSQRRQNEQHFWTQWWTTMHANVFTPFSRCPGFHPLSLPL
jgi:hypothetical protein